MDAVTPPNRDIPMDIIEEILLRLPVKSLIRFRCVSPSWNSKISESSFIRKHLARTTRKRLVITNVHDFPICDRVQTAYSWSLSSILNGQPLKDATDFVCPFPGDTNSDVKLVASCDELWCVQINKSMFLWNPSIRTYKEIPAPPPANYIYVHSYGMGYDSVGDDYKVLTIPFVHETLISELQRTHRAETQLYSLRSNAWRNIQPFPGRILPYANGKLVNGALHWILYTSPSGIVSFDLSTEKYGEVAQPEYSPLTRVGLDFVNITVLNGMLCLFVDYKDNGLVLWVMKEYGDEKSWTKIIEIGYHIITTITKPILLPLYLFEDGGVLILATFISEKLKNLFNDGQDPILATSIWDEPEKILFYKDEQTTVLTIVGCPTCPSGNMSSKRVTFVRSRIYVESLVSPAIWSVESASRSVDE